ncbi:hypothetical protein MIND_00137100 [Mycena indigotica]|uniref:Fungal-type protein kinase domain-containing protein n=1 Tax=Mycena indigotica TaxID=2126181 RepID=A0A8H6TF99_9AGAR|nr:uncharacterized protein MIND_00137100 [Mycena indigotica]KAF7316189.1 hypothetical protein MIND_00137100 [Mycena indigotica]
MTRELNGNTWQLPDDRVARMLGKKSRYSDRLIQGVMEQNGWTEGMSSKVDRLEFYACASDTDAFQTALSQCCQDPEPACESILQELLEATGEAEGLVHYTALSKFLNLCLQLAREFWPGFESSSYAKLMFLVYNRPTADGISGATPLKPDVAGVNSTTPHDEETLQVSVDTKLFWSKQEEQDILIDIPVEVKATWPALVLKAVAYSRAVFAASPFRRSALVLGFNQSTLELRFLIFHRGGLTSSRALKLRERSGREACMRFMLALSTCETHRDIGLPSWFNGASFKLPITIDSNNNATRFVDAVVEKMLHADVRSRGRATHVFGLSYTCSLTPSTVNLPPSTIKSKLPLIDSDSGSLSSSAETWSNHQEKVKREKVVSVNDQIRHDLASHPLGPFKFCDVAFSGGLVDNEQIQYVVLKGSFVKDDPRHKSIEDQLLKTCSSLFGCPNHHYSFLPVDEDGSPATNHLYLPTPEEVLNDKAQFHWKIFDQEPPDQPEFRSVSLHISSLVGSSLVLCETPWLLAMSVLHGMLGWLGMFQLGFLHRDPSMGNILRLQKAAKMAPFKLDHTLVEFNSADNGLAEMIDQLTLGGKNKPIIDLNYAMHSRRITQLLGTLDVESEVLGFIIDGDNAVKWHEFGSPRNATRSGTFEFMSMALRQTLESDTDHLHSPVDDLHAQFYVTQWAAAYHRDADAPSRPELREKSRYADALRQKLTRDRETATNTIAQLSSDDDRDLERYGRFLCDCAPLLARWNAKLSDLRRTYKATRIKIYKLFDEDKDKDKQEKLMRLLFMTFAYCGVADFMEVLAEWGSYMGLMIPSSGA